MTVSDDDGGTPANQGAVFTQAQVNHFVAEGKRGALDGFFKGELGLERVPTTEEFKGILGAATEHQKLKDGEKGDVERLTTELTTVKEQAAKLPTMEAQLLRARLAGDAGLKSRYWKYVEGDDEESIKASITETLADIRGGGDGEGEDGDDDTDDVDDTQQQRQGTGFLKPNPQQGAGGGKGKPKTTLAAGREAYEAKHGKKE